jgi:N-acetyl-gamma-glutamyl-phosphate reductase
MSTESRARVGVFGATGYAGRELIGLLARHPRVELVFATSESEANTPLRSVDRAAPPLTLVHADDAPLDQVDAVFSCLPHGASLPLVARARAAGARVVDLSNDLRVRGPATPEWAADVVYGLPELYRAEIEGSELVANPGCYPTAAILGLAPLLRRGLVDGPVIIDAASGISGAGRSPKRHLLFAEAAEDFRAYGVGNTHRHLNEMRAEVGKLAGSGAAPELVFTPHLLPVKRGILETIYVPLTEELEADEAIGFWSEDYANEPFVEVLEDRLPGLVDVTKSNRVSIGISTIEGTSNPLLVVVAAIDNLVKGASGQAVQNLNLMFGWPEGEGLN